MDDIMEAERFNLELEKILADKPVIADLDAELLADLAFAKKLSALDFSAESRAKAPAKAKILAKAEESLLRAYLRKVGVRPTVLAACALIVAVTPLAYMWLGSETAQYGGNRLVFLPHGGNAIFGSGSSPYEAGGSMQSMITGAAGNYDGSLSGGSGYAARGGRQTTFILPSLNLVQSAPEQQQPPLSREGYGYTPENPFERVADHPLSTFSIDVDGASYSNSRRMLNADHLPPADAVRVEEFVNYFHYEYPEPSGEHPFSITTELAACPWNPAHKLVRVGIKGKSIAKENLPPNNLVFLIDTSGSMMSEERLPLIKKGLRLLVEQLRKQDRISIVAYAGQAGLVLPPTSGAKKTTILDALEHLEAGGSTAGGAGIKLAYETAEKNFMKNGNNRVILATDGDFNVGVTSDGELTRLIEEKRGHGVFLTVLGVGQGNYQDHKMEQLADKGNGNYAYLDGILEAQKVLVKEMGATLLTIAKDVKIQVEFNPAKVQSYKLLGYEDRMLRPEDFKDDKKDAGELGAGGTVTALYEVVLAGAKEEGEPMVDPLKYQKPSEAAPSSMSGELLTVKFRYKQPKEDKSREIVRPLADENREWSQASPDFKFAAAAAGFAMTMRGSKTRGDLNYDKVRAMAAEGLVNDPEGNRAEMLRLIDKAKLLNAAAVPGPR